MRILLMLFLILFSIQPVIGDNRFQDDKHEVALISGYDSTGSLSAVSMGLHFKFNKDWKTYWRESGLVGYALKLDPSGSTNVKDVKIQWPMPDQFTTFGLKSYGYSKEVILPLMVVLKNPHEKAIVKLKLDYLVCDPAHCLRRKVTLDYTLNPQNQEGQYIPTKSPQFNLIQSYIDRIPRPDSGSGMTINRTEVDSSFEDHFVLKVYAHNPKGFRSPVLFVEPHSEMYVDFPVIIFSNNREDAVFVANVYANELRKDSPPVSLENKKITLTLKDRQVAIEADRNVKPQEHPLLQTFLIIIYAFVGGFILNFMPCVLPVILIKILSIFQQGGTKKSIIKRNFFLTVMGILSSFWFLAILSIIFKELGYFVGWGIQFQQPVFLVAIMLIITLFAFNLLGWFEILLPSNIATKLTEIETHESSISYFLSGAFVTILATPCTAPFLGTALSFALSRGSFEILTIFTVMGLGLALPYILIGLFPGVAHRLPKPGKWMNTFKKSLSLLLFLTLAWLLWNLSLIDGLMTAYIVGALFILIGILLFLKYRGTLKPRYSWGSILLVSIAALIVPELTVSTAHGKTLSGSTWEKFDQGKIDTYVKQGKTVFVDVTADWCLTCKANEILVLNTREVQKVFAEDTSIEMLADWTNGDEKVTTFLNRFGKYGVPFYVVFGPKNPDGIVLPEVLTKEIVEDNVNASES